MIVAGRYELLEPIGVGGEARVFRARDITTGSEVALRLTGLHGEEPALPPVPSPPDPAWVRMLEHGTDPQQGAFATFELLHGETLGTLVARRPLAVDAARFFADRSLHAVGALHASGWIHGDLNADNFLLQDGTTWKLLELPFHRLAPSTASPVFGSIHTLAPEQIDGGTADFRSDLFALGCLYYYAAAGVYPHAAGTGVEIAVARLRFPATPLRELAPHFPPSFTDGVMRLLARDPADRPESVAAACQLLMASDEPPPPRP